MVEVDDVRKSSQEVRLAVNNLYNTSSNQDMKTFVPIEGYGETINAALESDVLYVVGSNQPQIDKTPILSPLRELSKSSRRGHSCFLI